MFSIYFLLKVYFLAVYIHEHFYINRNIVLIFKKIFGLSHFGCSFIAFGLFIYRIRAVNFVYDKVNSAYLSFSIAEWGLTFGYILGLYRLCSTTFFQLIFFDSQTFTKNNINMWQLFEIRS